MATVSVSTCQQQVIIVEGIQQLYHAHQRLLKINPKQNPGFLIRHLRKIFEPEKEENEPESENMEKIRTVFEVYQTVSMYDSEDATAVLLENLGEIFSPDTVHGMITASHISTTPVGSEYSVNMNNDYEGKIESEFETEFVTQDHEANGTEEFQQVNSNEIETGEETGDIKTKILYPETQNNVNLSSSSSSAFASPSSVNTNFSHSNGHQMRTRESHKINGNEPCVDPLLPPPPPPLQVNVPPLLATKLAPVYSCHYCGKQFSTNGACQVHIRNHERFYPCSVCSLTFNDTFSLRRHEKFHNSSRISLSLSSSSYVGASSSSSSSVRAKPKSFQNKQQREGLNQSTIQSGKLRVPKPQRVSLQVSSNSNLTTVRPTPKKRGRPLGTKSVKLVKPVKPEKTRLQIADRTCKHCRKVCQSRGALIVHIRTHTGERPYECDLCHKAFSDPANFNKHKVQQHGKLSDILVKN